MARRLAYQGYLGDPVREPADDIHSDHSQHQLRHLPVGLALALGPLLPTGTHGAELDDDQDIEDEDES